MKKCVITAHDINLARKAGRTSLSVPVGALVTPQAADDARAYGIALSPGDLPQPRAGSPRLPEAEEPAQDGCGAAGAGRVYGIAPSPGDPPQPRAGSPRLPEAEKPAQDGCGAAGAGRVYGVAPSPGDPPQPRAGSLRLLEAEESAQDSRGAAAEVRRQVLARLDGAAPAGLDALIAAVMMSAPRSNEGVDGAFIRRAGNLILVSCDPDRGAVTPEVSAASAPGAKPAATFAAVPAEDGATCAPAAVSMVEALPPDGVHPGIAYMSWKNSSFSWTFPHSEVLVVLEGEIRLTADGGEVLAGKPGDAFLIPAGGAVTLTAGRLGARCVHSSWPTLKP
jgi:hypothetical protein